MLQRNWYQRVTENGECAFERATWPRSSHSRFLCESGAGGLAAFLEPHPMARSARMGCQERSKSSSSASSSCATFILRCKRSPPDLPTTGFTHRIYPPDLVPTTNVHISDIHYNYITLSFLIYHITDYHLRPQGKAGGQSAGGTEVKTLLIQPRPR